MPLLYLLHQPISVDECDSVGHTALMWAAYQGDVLSVDLLLKHGANFNLQDDSGLLPLHWAIVHGNKVCIHLLFEKGPKIHTKDNEGPLVCDMAVELKSLGAWKRALEEGGFTEDGSKQKKPLSDVSVLIDWDPCGTDIGDTSGYIHHPHDFPLHESHDSQYPHSHYPPVVYLVLAMAELFGMHHVRRFTCLAFCVSQHAASNRHSRSAKQADVH